MRYITNSKLVLLEVVSHTRPNVSWDEVVECGVLSGGELGTFLQDTKFPGSTPKFP